MTVLHIIRNTSILNQEKDIDLVQEAKKKINLQRIINIQEKYPKIDKNIICRGQDHLLQIIIVKREGPFLEKSQQVDLVALSQIPKLLTWKNQALV